MYGGTASEAARLVNESGVLNGEFEATAENVKDIPFNTLIDAIHVTQEELVSQELPHLKLAKQFRDRSQQ